MSKHLFLCNLYDPPLVKGFEDANSGRKVLRLNTFGDDENVNLKIGDINKSLLTRLTPRQHDLLEIAAFVYAADGVVSKSNGGWLNEGATEKWERDYKLVIPVRDLEFWHNGKNKNLLEQVLFILSDDKFDFEFIQSQRKPFEQEYFDFETADEPTLNTIERVVLFSGGLNSLAGATELAKSQQEIVLVSHRSVSAIDSRQRELLEGLRTAYPAAKIHRVPVWVNKTLPSKEYTQRTRSFLFWALAFVVCESIKAHGVRFYENGIVSMNLPISGEVTRARASRTTNPKVLSLYQTLSELISGRAIKVDNPYFWKTKVDVVSEIVNNGASNLIQYTSSCTRTKQTTGTQWHCGRCSQCIDRRFAMVAGKFEQYDPEGDYQSDVFLEEREKVVDQNMAISYVRHAKQLAKMDSGSFAASFNRELSLVLSSLRPMSSTDAAEAIARLHIQHGENIVNSLDALVQRHSKLLVSNELPSASLLSLSIRNEKNKNLTIDYVDRLAGILSQGLPPIYKSEPPANEPKLQAICDGLFKAANEDLGREFPYLKWGWVSTKPDFEAGNDNLLIELKYVRERKDLHPISEAVAADITKYGKNNVLFLIYDPLHLITDDKTYIPAFSKDYDVHLRFIR